MTTTVQQSRMSLAELPKTRAEQCALGYLLRYANESTRKGYQRSLRDWFQFCETHEIDPLEATRVHIEIWTRQLESAGLARRTIASKQNAVAGYYRFAVIDDLITKNPMDHVARVNVPRESSTIGLRGGELHDILKAAHGRSLRLHAVLMLLGLNGLRISEALGLDVEDIDMERGWRTIRVLRKGGKYQTLPLSPPVAYAIEQYLDGRDTGAVFITKTGTRVTRNQIGKEIKAVCRDIGITKRVHPHSFRHAFVTQALDAGVPIRDVQNSTGHADSRMVTYYDRNRDSLERNATHAVSARVLGRD